MMNENVDKLPDCEMATTLKLLYGDIEPFEYEFDSVEYKLYLLGKILFRLPCCIGEWFLDRGYATKNYYGVRIKK